MGAPKRRVTVMAVAMLAALLSSSIPAVADHGWDSILRTQNTHYSGSQYQWACGSFPCLADNSYHSYYVSSAVPNYLSSRITATRVSSYNYTDVTMAEWGSPSGVDVVYAMDATLADLPVPAAGQYRCDDPVDSTRCNSAHVYFENGNAYRNRTNSDYLQKLACHETGHSVGLVHGVNSSYEGAGPNNGISTSNTTTWLECMISGPTDRKGLGSHQGGEINGVY